MVGGIPPRRLKANRPPSSHAARLGAGAPLSSPSVLRSSSISGQWMP
jgi:hypothetical protein